MTLVELLDGLNARLTRHDYRRYGRAFWRSRSGLAIGIYLDGNTRRPVQATIAVQVCSLLSDPAHTGVFERCYLFEPLEPCLMRSGNSAILPSDGTNSDEIVNHWIDRLFFYDSNLTNTDRMFALLEQAVAEGRPIFTTPALRSLHGVSERSGDWTFEGPYNSSEWHDLNASRNETIDPA